MASSSDLSHLMARLGVDALWDADMSSSDDGDDLDDSPLHGPEAKTMATGEWDRLLKGTVLDPSTSVEVSGKLDDDADEDMFEGGETSTEEEEEGDTTKASRYDAEVGEVFGGGRAVQPGAFAAYKPTYYDMVSSEAAAGPSLLGQWPKLRHPYLQQHLSFRASIGLDGRMAMPVEATLNRYRVKVLLPVLPSAESLDASFVEQCFSALTSVDPQESTAAPELFDIYRSYEEGPGYPSEKEYLCSAIWHAGSNVCDPGFGHDFAQKCIYGGSEIMDTVSHSRGIDTLRNAALHGTSDDLRPWLSDVNSPIPAESDALQRAFHQLIAADVTGATRSLQAAGYPRLARIAAILGFDSTDWESARSEGTVSILRQQLAQWKLDSSGEIKGTVAAVYQLLAGEVGSEEVLSRCSSWTAKFAAYYCYGTKPDGQRYSLVETIEAVGQGSGVDWELLRVRAGVAKPDTLAEALLNCAVPEPFTAFLAFLTYSTLDGEATLGSLPATRLASITAQWLETIGLWPWAALVYCEYLWVPSTAVQQLVTDLIYRNIPQPSDAFLRTVLSLPIDDRGAPVFPGREGLFPQPVIAALTALLGEDDLNALLWSAVAPRIDPRTRDSRLASAVCYLHAGDWRGAARVIDRELLSALEDVILGGDAVHSWMSAMIERLAFLASGGTSGIADPTKDWIHFANAVMHDDVLTSNFLAKCKASNNLGEEKEALLRGSVLQVLQQLLATTCTRFNVNR
ncbi:Ribosomal protein [Perkinsus olseni]|uniref:Ribosomal protein n=1 Tax=Perkinsus olseni TaxID=32597 RepID=A0A7J6PID3_PEROL|nr:Ribosomal protein [Perkinsus olseni]